MVFDVKILKNLLKEKLEMRLKRLEMRNASEINDLKYEKDAYKKQGLLLNKLKQIKITPPKNSPTPSRGRSYDRMKTSRILKNKEISPSKKPLIKRNLTPVPTRSKFTATTKESKQPLSPSNLRSSPIKLNELNTLNYTASHSQLSRKIPKIVQTKHKERTFDNEKIRSKTPETVKNTRKKTDKNTIPSYMRGTASNATKTKEKINNFYSKLREQREEKARESEAKSKEEATLKQKKRGEGKEGENYGTRYVLKDDKEIKGTNIMKPIQSKRQNSLSDIISPSKTYDEKKIPQISNITQNDSTLTNDQLTQNATEDKSIRVSNIDVTDNSTLELLRELRVENKKLETNITEREKKRLEKENECMKDGRRFVMSKKGFGVFEKIVGFLPERGDDRVRFYLLNKETLKYYVARLEIEKFNFLEKNHFSSYNTIESTINSLKMKYKPEELNIIKNIELSKGTVKAISLLNEDLYNQIFKSKAELKGQLTEIVFVYRIFFMFCNNKVLINIKDDALFWDMAKDYILKNNGGKTGDFIKKSLDKMDFTVQNIYKIRHLISGKEEKLKPVYFSKIEGTTGLLIFIIKDLLEYIGALPNEKKNDKGIMFKYYNHLLEVENRLTGFINKIENFKPFLT